MNALYVDGLEDILAVAATGPSASNDVHLENGRPDAAVIKASVLGEELGFTPGMLRNRKNRPGPLIG